MQPRGPTVDHTDEQWSVVGPRNQCPRCGWSPIDGWARTSRPASVLNGIQVQDAGVERKPSLPELYAQESLDSASPQVSAT